MEKNESTALVVRVIVAVAIIFAGIALIELFNKPGDITAKTINPIETAGCVNVVDMEYQGIDDKDNCCRLIQQTDSCKLLDGVLRLEYTEGSRTAEPKAAYNANYACYAASTTLYFSFDTYEYCELKGYRIILS